jgi:trigger factor
MKAELTDISQCKKSFEIEVPQDVVDNEIARISRDLARRAKVPGFRPGKAPATVVRARYREEIVSEMMQHLLPKYFREAAEGRNLDLVDIPQYEDIDYASGQPLRFKAVFEVYPRLEISNYTGVPAEEISSDVSQEDVEASLKKLQEDMSELTPVEESRPLREGDFADITFNGISGGDAEPKQPIVSDKAVVEIGGRNTLKEFTENLLGANPNEERTFTVQYPHDYPAERLAGKAVEYSVRVEGLKEKKIPELNDEFAQGLGEYQTLEDLRSKIRADMEKHKREHANEQVREKMLEWLEDNNDFEPPETLVERQIQTRMKRLIRDLSRQGIDPQRLDVDWAKIHEDQRKNAVRDVKGSLILDYIAEKESLTVTEQEIDDEIDRIANETKRPKEKVREVLSRDSGLHQLERQIRHKKSLDFVQSQARKV